MKNFLFILILVFTVVLALRKNVREPSVPNILLITIDTLRADHLGCYGYSRKLTPNLDRLASGGILFENAFSLMPTTFPSHCSILFGTWPRVLGTLSNYTNVSTSLPYLPALMKKAGYHTAAFLSVYHLGMALEPLSGFDQFHFPSKDFPAEITLNLGKEWLAEKHSKFFLWIHLFDPHNPYVLHPDAMKKINPEFDNDFEKLYGFMPPGFYSAQGKSKMIDLYDNEIAYVDDQLGRFLDSSRQNHLLDNTVIVVAADHGETLDELETKENYAFEHGEYLSNGQLHVPLIVSLSGDAQGLRVHRNVSLIDIFPTILEIARIRTGTPSHGTSLGRFWQQSSQKFPEQSIFLQRRDYKFPPLPFLAQTQYGIIERDFKLLWNVADKKSVLVRNQQEVGVGESDRYSREVLSKHLANWLRVTATYRKHKGYPVSAEVGEKLRSLGYIQ